MYKCKASLLFQRVSIVVFTTIAIFFTSSCTQRVKIYPAPEGIELSSAFNVTVEGKGVPVYKTKVPPKEPIPRLNHSRSEFGYASLASFDMNSEVGITVTYPEKVTSVKILPTSYGVIPKVKGNKISFSIDNPKHVTVEVNGDWQESLHIFANPMEENIPDPNDPNVIYFGPGIHEIVHLSVGDKQTVYLAGGAYVRCSMDPNEKQVMSTNQQRYLPTFRLNGNNISFRGRGIVEQETIPRAKRRYTLLAEECDDVTIEGVTFLDPSRWTIPIKRSKNVHVDNIKIIGWRGNADGVDISSSRDVLVENCFLRTLDDLIVVKSRTGQGEAKNIHARNCVLWNELAHAVSIGAELRQNVSNVLFEDMDVIHDVGRETAMRIYHCDSATVSDVTFQNIRVEEARRLISCWIGSTRWTKTKERGHIKNVLFKDIIATSAPIDTTLKGFQDGSDWKPYIIKDHASMELIGYDEKHIVDGVVFDNVVLDGKKVTKGQVTMNEFVKNVSFK
ncbi:MULTISPECIES: glycosyl hydrolase family 28 protein [unclassified Saccharicrinis]|uniref:glycosyl hydrolase family 28 protein n=1 Tax=unclassified Saccharicrinis TaxID=2646859 RepID=UPI003D34D007